MRRGTPLPSGESLFLVSIFPAAFTPPGGPISNFQMGALYPFVVVPCDSLPGRPRFVVVRRLKLPRAGLDFHEAFVVGGGSKHSIPQLGIPTSTGTTASASSPKAKVKGVSLIGSRTARYDHSTDGSSSPEPPRLPTRFLTRAAKNARVGDLDWSACSRVRHGRMYQLDAKVTAAYQKRLPQNWVPFSITTISGIPKRQTMP
ncbi:hypothetical protein Nepgr_033097 [Nepenthes gracilis]|uniref:Uncharacterized protein n=1 Tax=Nepenthes gracilis TaxID=150966 RepID=A0AAD3TL99_NEPGR|nr:hypothetical protein Nepgr_033097 [Nepenthes gracilis]